jgi:alcohol dehydrogenase
VIAIDPIPAKRELASQLGADMVYDSEEADCVEVLREVTRGGVDYAFEMAGSVQAMDMAYRITRRGGTTVSAGLSHPARDFALKHISLVAEERTVKGSYLGGCVPARDIPRLIALYRQGRLPVDRLLSERVALDDINIAFDRLAAGATVRQIVLP